jgi:hypothetical protein
MCLYMGLDMMLGTTSMTQRLKSNLDVRVPATSFIDPYPNNLIYFITPSHGQQGRASVTNQSWPCCSEHLATAVLLHVGAHLSRDLMQHLLG